MNPDAKLISQHMKEFGLSLLGRALVDVTFSEMLYPFAHAMGVTRCAHAAEIIIKARIAEEHPLLIFTKLPKPPTQPSRQLSLKKLLAEGETVPYHQLPHVLWATTGYHIPHLEQFKKFGSLRNTITHFAVPNDDLPRETYRYAFQVIEPMIYEFWKADIISCHEQFGEEEERVHEQLRQYSISFVRR